MVDHPRSRHPAIEYIRALYAKEDAVLTAINAKLEAENVSWQVGPEEGKLLQLLMRMHGTKTIVEVGTLAGYSTLWMARVLPEDGHIYTLEKNPAHAAWAEDFFTQAGVKERITVMVGDANTSLNELSANAPFDMLFIDADKRGYLDYLTWGEQAVRTGGLIIADNTLLFDSVYRDAPTEDVAPSTWQMMREFNERMADTTKFESLLLPTEQGLTVAIRR